MRGRYPLSAVAPGEALLRGLRWSVLQEMALIALGVQGMVRVALWEKGWRAVVQSGVSVLGEVL